MDESIGELAKPGRSRPWLTSLSLSESLNDDPPPTYICRLRPAIVSRPSYEIAFRMSFCGKFDKWYKVKAHAEIIMQVENDELTKMHPIWEGNIPGRSRFAVLGCDIYRLGGDRVCDTELLLSLFTKIRQGSGSLGFEEFVYDRALQRSWTKPELYKLDTICPTEWFHVTSMIISGNNARALLVDGKIYVLYVDPSEYYVDHSQKSILDGKQDIEGWNRLSLMVYEPGTRMWKTLSRAPLPMEADYFICAALENPNRILVASLSDETLLLCQYDVLNGCWKVLHKPERKVHSKYPLGDACCYYYERAVSVGNTLYWVTDNNKTLVAYEVDNDAWLFGCLRKPEILTLQSKCNPNLTHLEGQTFCMVQRVKDSDCEVQCVMIDIYRKSKTRLGISVLSVHRYEMDERERLSCVENCFFLGKQI